MTDGRLQLSIISTSVQKRPVLFSCRELRRESFLQQRLIADSERLILFEVKQQYVFFAPLMSSRCNYGGVASSCLEDDVVRGVAIMKAAQLSSVLKTKLGEATHFHHSMVSSTRGLHEQTR